MTTINTMHTSKLRRQVTLTVLLITLTFAGGCATLFRTGKQKVLVETDPTGATLIVDNKSYVTPITVTVKRKKSYDVVVKKEGYQSVRFQLHPHWDAGGVGAVAMDAIIPGGSVLFLIDTVAGADRQFNKIAKITLPPTTAPTTQIVTLYEHDGVLLDKVAYDEAKAADGLFGKKTKKPVTSETTNQAD